MEQPGVRGERIAGRLQAIEGIAVNVGGGAGDQQRHRALFGEAGQLAAHQGAVQRLFGVQQQLSLIHI